MPNWSNCQIVTYSILQEESGAEKIHDAIVIQVYCILPVTKNS